MKTITKQTIEKYRKITTKAYNIAKKSAVKSKVKQAKEILEMTKCYLDDSKHFEEKGDYVNAFGAIYYAHGWLDCGARLKVFNVTDSDLFTV